MLANGVKLVDMGRILQTLQHFFQNFRATPLLSKRFVFSYAGQEEDEEEEVFYEDEYFLGDPMKDNPSLATCSLSLAMASFSSNKVREGLKYQAENGINFLQNCAFFDIETPAYFGDETSQEGIAFVIGRKRIKRKKTKPFTLIAIGVRGRNYGREWASNVKVGLTDRHEGFNESASQLQKAFLDYVLRHSIKGEVRVWVSGFSRAAAVTNLFTQDLPAQIEKASIKATYAYCFACPNVTRVNSLAPSSTHNYINPNDIVPGVPLKEWGYSRYGQVTYLKTELVPDEFSQIRIDVVHIFDKQKRFRREPGLDKRAFLDRLCVYLGERIGLVDYVQRLQEGLCAFMGLVDTKLQNPYQALGDVLGETFRMLGETYGAFSLLRMIRSPKTEWDRVLLPLIERAVEGKPYVLDSALIASTLSDFLFLIRQDLWDEREMFLTLCDMKNIRSVFSEHDPTRYLNALKKLDPHFMENA